MLTKPAGPRPGLRSSGLSFPPHPTSWLSVLFQDTWLYHLTVAAGGSSAKVGTAYEQLIGKLMDDEGDPGKAGVAIRPGLEGGGWVVVGQGPKESTAVP